MKASILHPWSRARGAWFSLEEKKINKIAESVVRDQEMQKKERILSRINVFSGGKPSKGKTSKNINLHPELEHHINDI